MIESINAARHRHAAGNRRNTPKKAMILAAGLGRRMLPITERIPKPLVRVRGKVLIDYAIDSLVRIGVQKIVVNVHHHAGQLEEHLRAEKRAEIVISDEREKLLDSGGAVARAIGQLGGDPFFVVNADSFWIEGFRPNLENMAALWDADRMEILLLVSGMASTIGYRGMGDFTMDPEGRLTRRGERLAAPFVYAGAGIFDSGLFENLQGETFSLNRQFDHALERERLFGVRLDGLWFHIGTPESIREAEEAIARSAA